MPLAVMPVVRVVARAAVIQRQKSNHSSAKNGKYYNICIKNRFGTEFFTFVTQFFFFLRIIKMNYYHFDDSNRLFQNQMEVEFHAAKSGHSNFSESTEEKKPLTEEEKKQQLVRLEEKLRQKRMEREESEKREAREREKFRIKSGKDMSEVQRKIEEQEMKKLVEQRKREKQEDREARERVRAQIESDKAARREQMAA